MKRLLVTGGASWVALDTVRIITNRATGATAALIAAEARRCGMRVEVICGPCAFEEMRSRIRAALRAHRFDAIIHAAAVSDFAPRSRIRSKLNSRKAVTLHLRPLPKILGDIRRLAPRSCVVMFKYEPGVGTRLLLSRARAALESARADLSVANTDNPYQAFILDATGSVIGKAKSKQQLARRLIRCLLQTI